MLVAGLAVIGGAVLVALTILAFAVLNGTILYYVWPSVMVTVFHFPELTWAQAVCLSWVCGILIKGSNNTTVNK